MQMKFGGNTESELRALWQQHCAPWIEMGNSFVYGSPHDIEHEKLKREIEAEERAAKQGEPARG